MEQNTCSEEQCYYLTDDQNNAVPGQTGFCDPSDDPKGISESWNKIQLNDLRLISIKIPLMKLDDPMN